MPRRLGSYIGVTGFMASEEVHAALTLMPTSIPRRLVVGVLMSDKTLAGKTNKWPGRYPKREAVADIFPDSRRVFNLVHYSTDHPETLDEQLEEIVANYGGPNLHGFQLNVPWPSFRQVCEFGSRHPELVLVLQIGSKAIQYAGSIQGCGDLIGRYGRMIDAILLDTSGGKGRPFDPVWAAFYLAHISQQHPNLGLGVAGGLDPDTVHSLVSSLAHLVPDLSIDAEGQLRTPHPEDALSRYKIHKYIGNACLIFS